MNAALPNAVNMNPKFTFTFSAIDGNCSWFSRNTSEPAWNLIQSFITRKGNQPHTSQNIISNHQATQKGKAKQQRT